jgi:hypothetical protein
LFYFVEKTFVFALPDDGEVCTFRIFRCFLVEIYGDLQFIADAFSQLLCAGNRFFPVDVADWNKWANIGRPHARVRAFVFAHINQFRRFLNPAKRAFHRGFRAPNKSYNGAVGRYAGINIQQRHPVD